MPPLLSFSLWEVLLHQHSLLERACSLCVHRQSCTGAAPYCVRICSFIILYIIRILENSPCLSLHLWEKMIKKNTDHHFLLSQFQAQLFSLEHRKGSPYPVPSAAFPTPLPCSLWYRGSWYKCNCSNFFHILLGERMFLLLKGISNPLAIPFISSAQWMWKHQLALALPFHPPSPQSPQSTSGEDGSFALVRHAHAVTARRQGQHTNTDDSFINIEGQLLCNNAELTTRIFYL